MVKKGAFDTFSVEDVLRGDTWKGRKLTPEELELLKSQAAEFKSSVLWKILSSEAQWFAIKSLIESGKDGDDIRAARAIGNVVQVFQKKLDELSK